MKFIIICYSSCKKLTLPVPSPYHVRSVNSAFCSDLAWALKFIISFGSTVVLCIHSGTQTILLGYLL